MTTTSPDTPTGDRGADGRPRISGLITCFNEEANIADCIESLLWCDEILVVDSFSTDRTPEIARGYDKVRLVQRKYYGGASQKNWAMERVAHEWILIFDSDERCTPELRREIEDLLAAGATADSYTIRRRAYFMGKCLRFSGWRNDRVARLIRRGAGYYENRRVHARLVTRGPSPMLRSSMEHFMVQDLEEYTLRNRKYAVWGAAQAWRDGKRAGPGHLLLRPAWRFVRSYVVYLGVLDGLAGLVFCLMQAGGTFTKWSVLWGWQLQAAQGVEPELPEFDEDREVWKKAEELLRSRSATRS